MKAYAYLAVAVAAVLILAGMAIYRLFHHRGGQHAGLGDRVEGETYADTLLEPLPGWDEHTRECSIGDDCGTMVHTGPIHRYADLAPEALDREVRAPAELPLGATFRDGMPGHRDLDAPAGDRSPESGSLSPRTDGGTLASVTAGQAPSDLPAPVAGRAGEADPSDDWDIDLICQDALFQRDRIRDIQAELEDLRHQYAMAAA